MNKAFESAFLYAEDFGFQVFPCIENGKKPLTEHGFKDATDDPEQILKWNNKYPRANWAVATGSKSGVFVVDIDSNEAEQWFASKWILEGSGVETPRGGRHIYYRYTGENVDLGITNGSLSPGFDTRGNGGYVMLPGSKTSSKVDPSYGDGEYVGDLSGLRETPEVPQALIDLIPEKQSYATLTDEQMGALSDQKKPSAVSPQEERVLKGLLGLLDDLKVPWEPGAGWHSTGFFVACALNRVANSPEYATTRDQARAMYLKHAPINPTDKPDIWTVRWNSAVKQVGNQIAEPPGDVPVLLDPMETLDALIGRSPSSRTALESGFYDSKTVRDTRNLIRELRQAGATEQEAYSVSRECRAMKQIRQKNPDNAGSTWGWVKAEYEAPAPKREVVLADKKGADNGSLLTDAERDIIRDIPNFIDDYIGVAKEMFAEPNLPLHYVNAWVALSCIFGDKSAIITSEGRRPLNIWSIHAAPSASGKRGSMETLEQVVNNARGWGNVYLGEDASAEEMADILLERGMDTGLFMQDEASRLLEGMHSPGQSYERKFVTAALKWYDGKVSRAIRRGMDRSEVGATSNTVFNMWLQTTWDNIFRHLTPEDISTGFVGRFIFALGEKAKITRDSLTPKFADEYQVNLGGDHPAAIELGRRMREMIPLSFSMTAPDAGVIERYVDAREEARARVAGHDLAEQLDGIILRLSEQMMKGAFLLALSEGRDRPVMTDMLLAIKSFGYWLRDLMIVVDEIGKSDYRKRIEAIVKFVGAKPRTRADIYGWTYLRDVDKMIVDGALVRAEQEGRIRLAGERWEAVE